ncbi:hypothetical protein DFH27DRAFT_624708 [Peziza echinospora]|nr:hypothetical protein DFH27DRAFT_624708 [Peziza echinospora]
MRSGAGRSRVRLATTPPLSPSPPPNYISDSLIPSALDTSSQHQNTTPTSLNTHIQSRWCRSHNSAPMPEPTPSGDNQEKTPATPMLQATQHVLTPPSIQLPSTSPYSPWRSHMNSRKWKNTVHLVVRHQGYDGHKGRKRRGKDTPAIRGKQHSVRPWVNIADHHPPRRGIPCFTPSLPPTPQRPMNGCTSPARRPAAATPPSFVIGGVRLTLGGRTRGTTPRRPRRNDSSADTRSTAGERCGKRKRRGMRRKRMKLMRKRNRARSRCRRT